MTNKPLEAIPYYNYIYIDFDMLIDTDYGLIRFINENYADERVFMIELLDEDEYLLKGLLKTRENYNPLIVPSEPEIKIELLDKLYKEFNEKYQYDIIMSSCTTTLLEMCKKCIESETYTYITVMCKNKLEQDIISKYFENLYKGFDTVLYDDEGTIDVSKATVLMVKHPKSLIRYSNLSGKSIYLADLDCNINMDIYEKNHIKYPNDDGILFYQDNDFKFITMYPYDNSYSIDDDFEGDIEDDYDEEDEESDNGKYPFEDEEDITEGDVALLEEWLDEDELYEENDPDDNIDDTKEDIRVSNNVLDNTILREDN